MVAIFKSKIAKVTSNQLEFINSLKKPKIEQLSGNQA